MTEFTPWSALAGGALIGLAAVMLMQLNGRIAGISGIVGGVLALHADGLKWKLAFIAGLVLAPLLFALATGGAPQVVYPHPNWMVVLGGLFVGFGVRLGSGCTSGHGVCGVARLSKRSLVATATFMTSGIVAVFILHHLSGVL